MLSAAQAIASVAAGANRVELCGPGDGGTTPSLALVEACVSAVQVPVHVMLRPHAESFLMDAEWLAIMQRDMLLAQRAGAHGFVCGVLTREHEVDVVAMRGLLKAARGAPVVFHRAFDKTRDAARALDALCTLGVTAVLTSGHAPSASEGAEQLAAWQRQVGSALTVMAGGGVRATNVARLLEAAPLHAVHARGTDATVIAALVRVVREIVSDPYARRHPFPASAGVENRGT